nr:aminoglycoside 3'-phosphotransferase [Actinomycetota bacterium]
MVAGDAASLVPAAVARVAAGRTTRAVWANEAGGRTFEVGHDPERVFVKWTPVERAWELEAETRCLRWAVAFSSVPAVIDEGSDDNGAWLVTTPLHGDNAVSPRWKAEPAVAVRAIGRGPRALHDALPVTECPFWWSAGSDRPTPAVGVQ